MCEVSAILRSGRNKTKSKKSKKKKDSNDDTISGASGTIDAGNAVVCVLFIWHFFINLLEKNLIFNWLWFSEEKEDANNSVESTPQITPNPVNTNAAPQTPSNEQQPEVDEDGYCIQPKDPLWNTQWTKKGIHFGL